MSRRGRDPEYVRGGSMVVHFGPTFLREATCCVHRALHEAQAQDVAGATMGAILLACAALEADLAEGATTANLPVEIRRRAREGALDDRYRIVLNHVSAGSRCKQTEEFRDLRALVALRNAVAHRSAAFLSPGTWPRELRPHAARLPVQPGSGQDWTSVVFTAPVARWAVRVAWHWQAWVNAHWAMEDPNLRAGTSPADDGATGSP